MRLLVSDISNVMSGTNKDESGKDLIMVTDAVFGKISGVVIHEFAHYVSGYSDNTRDFENVLTEILGFIYSELTFSRDTPKKKFSLFGKL